jgi:uncharacterized protein YdhG (YjbR/CyaY superfamily)
MSDKKSEGFSAEEKAAMKERAKELKSAANAAEAEQGVLDKIAEMPPADRVIAEGVHAVVKAHAPSLAAKTWYGQPAYSRDGKVVVFFQSAAKFDTRYPTLGFSEDSRLDDGAMWPTSYALTAWNATTEAAVTALVKRAAG